MTKMIEGKGNLTKTPSPRGLEELKELQTALKLARLPMRIECFDISNIQGTNMVGSLVVFLGGVPLKKDYRRFKITGTGQKADDVRSIYEVVLRRYRGSLAQKLDWPDLVMVDGGLAQVNFGEKGLRDAGRQAIPIIGLAKREEEIYFPGQRKTLRLGQHSRALQLLQRIRDEAHRFAVNYHRVRRGKALFR